MNGDIERQIHRCERAFNQLGEMFRDALEHKDVGILQILNVRRYDVLMVKLQLRKEQDKA